MKTVFDRLVSRRNMTEERISELEDISIDISKGKQILKKKVLKKGKK